MSKSHYSKKRKADAIDEVHMVLKDITSFKKLINALKSFNSFGCIDMALINNNNTRIQFKTSTCDKWNDPEPYNIVIIANYNAVKNIGVNINRNVPLYVLDQLFLCDNTFDNECHFKLSGPSDQFSLTIEKHYVDEDILQELNKYLILDIAKLCEEFLPTMHTSYLQKHIEYTETYYHTLLQKIGTFLIPANFECSFCFNNDFKYKLYDLFENILSEKHSVDIYNLASLGFIIEINDNSVILNKWRNTYIFSTNVYTNPYKQKIRIRLHYYTWVNLNKLLENMSYVSECWLYINPKTKDVLLKFCYGTVFDISLYFKIDLVE